MAVSRTNEAIILRARAYGESDKIVTFLTDDAGKLTGIAKGAKNSRRRFANCLDPLTRVRVHFRARPGASMVFMESCELLRAAGVFSEPRKFAYASYLVELVDQLTEDEHPVRELYDLLTEALDEIQRGAATAAFLRAFELRLLRHAGYDPQLSGCARCHRPVDGPEHVYLDVLQGSIVCAQCRARGEAFVPIAAETLAGLSAIRTLPLAAARDCRLGRTCAAEAAQVMAHLLAQHLPRPLRSVKLIAALSR
jgi:DNA repair protein RecO (recombination protein O)